MSKLQQQGIALVMILLMLLVVAIFAQVIIKIISSQSRFTHHQASRIRAYYVGQAAMNLTFEKLKTGDWVTGAYSLCAAGCTVNDPDIPYRVDITVGAPGTGLNNTRQISLSVDYTFTPPS